MERNDGEPLNRIGEPRFYMDGDERWRVQEVAAPSWASRRGSDLVFSSESAWRRVTRYPAGWAELSDEELVALSWSR